HRRRAALRLPPPGTGPRGPDVLRDGVAATEQFRRSRRGRPRLASPIMLTALAISQIYVLDQDEALDFYVGKLGLEVHTDADLGFMRWLTLNVPGAPERQILLEKPGPPACDDATAAQIRDVLTKGAAG